MVQEHLKEVRERIEAACRRAGRNPRAVTLIAVSKTKPAQMVQEAYEAGAREKIRFRKFWRKSRLFLRIFAGI